MKFKRSKKLALVSILLAILLLSALLLTGCVRGLSPIGWSGVAVADGLIYAGSKQGRLVSVDLDANNARRFAEPIRAASAGGGACGLSGGTGCGGAPPAVAIYGTPALTEVPVLGNLVYIAGFNGKVYAYTADTLQQRWIFPIEGNLSSIVSAIVVSGDTLYFGCTDSNVYALDASTGAQKWRFTTGGEIWATPAVEDNLLVIGSFDNNIYGIDATSGQELWRFATQSTNAAPALIIEDTVYVGSLDRNMYALNAADGTERWHFTAENWFWARPVFHNGILFAPSLDHRVYGLDESGKNVVTWDLGGPIPSWPVLVGNQLITATQDSRFWAMNTDPANFGSSESQRQIGSLPEGVETIAPLAASGDEVYVNASDNNIYIINVVNQTISSPISLQSQ